MKVNTYFHSIFASHLTNSLGNLDDAIQHIQDSVYNYFARTCGTIPAAQMVNYEQTYNSLSIKFLKRALMNLKKLPSTTSSGGKIRYLSRLIRMKLMKLVEDNENPAQHLKTKFWSTIHIIFDSAA